MTLGGGGHPRASWWKQTLGTDYYSQGGGASVFDDLISYWGFNDLKEFGLPFDSAGTNNVSVIEGATLVDGKIGKAYRFTSSGNSYVKIPDSDTLSFNGGSDGNPDKPFAYWMWINPTNSAANRWLVSKRGSPAGGSPGTQCEYQIARLTDGKIRVIIFSGGGSTVFLQGTSSGAAAQDEYSFVVCSYDGSGTVAGMSIWINGVLQEVDDTGTTGTYVSMNAGTSNLSIGQQSWDDDSASGFIGDIDEVGLLNRVPTQEEVDYLLNNGAGRQYTRSPDVFEIQLNVLATRDNYQFATDGSDLLWSNDGGETWINDYEWGTQFSGGIPVYDKYIDFAYIFSDGTVLFACGALLFRSDDQLLTVDSVTAYQSDGVTPYAIHTPAESTMPGSYFQAFALDARHYEDDVLLWVNYCNVVPMGAAPINVWYTSDKGLTVKSVYTFGQNPNYRDDGTDDGGATGTLLGDAGNALITRHGHGVARNPDNLNEWYITTGDEDDDDEIHWLQLTRDPQDETFTADVVIEDAVQNNKFKAGAISIHNGHIYWSVDANGGVVPETDANIFRAQLSDIEGTVEHLLYYDDGKTPASIFSHDTGKLIFAFGDADAALQNKLLIYENYGRGASKIYTIVGSGASNLLRKFYPANSEGYVKVNVGGINQNITKTLFVKA